MSGFNGTIGAGTYQLMIGFFDFRCPGMGYAGYFNCKSGYLQYGQIPTILPQLWLQMLRSSSLCDKKCTAYGSYGVLILGHRVVS